MSFLNLFACFAMLLALTLVPGPLNTIFMAGSFLGEPADTDICFGFGIAVGNVLVVMLAVFSLGIWLQSVPEFFTASRVLATSYILWEACSKLRDGMQRGDRNEAGTLTRAMLPRALILSLTVLPALLDPGQAGARHA